MISAPLNPSTTPMSLTTIDSDSNINGRGPRGPPGQKGEQGRNVCPIGNLQKKQILVIGWNNMLPRGMT